MRQRERSASNASLESRGEMDDSRGEEGRRKSVKKTTARGRDSPSTQFTLSFCKYEAPDLRLNLTTAALLCLWIRLRSSDLHSSDPRMHPPSPPPEPAAVQAAPVAISGNLRPPPSLFGFIHSRIHSSLAPARRGCSESGQTDGCLISCSMRLNANSPVGVG